MESTTTFPASTSAAADALTLLKQDHDKVDELFAQCEPGSGSAARGGDVLRQLCRELKIHSAIEEQVFYPALRQAGVPDGLLDEAEEEHDDVRQLVARIESGSDESVREPLRELKLAVRQHVQKEEGEMFAAARKCGVDLNALGQRLADQKRQLGQTIGARG